MLGSQLQWTRFLLYKNFNFDIKKFNLDIEKFAISLLTNEQKRKKSLTRKKLVLFKVLI